MSLFLALIGGDRGRCRRYDMYFRCVIVVVVAIMATSGDHVLVVGGVRGGRGSATVVVRRLGGCLFGHLVMAAGLSYANTEKVL